MTISLMGVLQVIAICIASYIAIIIILRISGKRTLSKMNAFDFIVTVALGSVLATTIVSYRQSFWNGIITFAMLVGLQFISTWLSVRFKPVQKLIKSEPTLLFYDGAFHDKALKDERISKEEMKQAIRKAGFVSFEGVAAIILESDGTLTVMSQSDKKKIKKEDFIFIE